MAFNWDENQESEFRDIPDEVNEGYVPDQPLVTANVVNPPRQRQAAQAPVVQEPDHDFGGMADDGSQDEEEDYESVLADANLRIELATLYKLIMNHDLFDGVDVDARAIDTVHREIRKFARERMEIMLGMRQETPKEAIVSSPFNDLEVVVLKKLASTYSKGATETAEASKPQPVAKAIARREGLNTISAPRAPAPTKKLSSKPLSQQPQAPVQRQSRPTAPVIAEDDVKPLGKPLNELTEEEIIQRNKESSARQAAKKSVKSAIALPQPSPDQEEMFHATRVIQTDNPLSSPTAVSAILSALNKSKSQ